MCLSYITLMLIVVFFRLILCPLIPYIYITVCVLHFMQFELTVIHKWRTVWYFSNSIETCCNIVYFARKNLWVYVISVVFLYYELIILLFCSLHSLVHLFLSHLSFLFFLRNFLLHYIQRRLVLLEYYYISVQSRLYIFFKKEVNHL